MATYRIVKKTDLNWTRRIDNLLSSHLLFATILRRQRPGRFFFLMLQLPYYLACSLMPVEPTTIAVCLAIGAIAVRIVQLLLDTFLTGFRV